MPVVVFAARSGSAPLEADCPEGGRLLDVCDELSLGGHAAPVPFSCRSATCGSCRVDVIEGSEWLEPPEVRERETLAVFGDDPAKRRLACQARLRAGGGATVRIRSVSA
jgi:2Fe-2S ferredoxin